MAEELAAQIVSSARHADMLLERQREFKTIEICSQSLPDYSFTPDTYGLPDLDPIRRAFRPQIDTDGIVE
eukprot:CAMPEP_0119338636 /NCGR_PEP_ID=MMETSP1333-20130426/96561_1 /TAXON_ID=418940 /ORGANISM="Scyphosphaera apsteinii, Strain RCC1455" /LENGTH=69 /DNA_ID=CAMNT_0007349965 /DNA_START=32 /DNA_END=238 /DNA_ORIENTATION=+